MMPLTPAGEAVWTLFIFLAGLCLGSFLNVCIWRIPREESLVWPGSHCPACRHPIAPWDNIPLLSWLVLAGRCRHCRAPIWFRYFVVELLTGALFTGLWLVHGWTIQTPVYCLYTGALLLGTFVDLDHLILPDRVTLGGMAAGLVLSAAFPALQGQEDILSALRESVLGLVVGYGILWLVAVVGRLVLRRDAMGLGDVKLLGAVGACLGWPAVLFTIFVSSLTGTLLGLGLIAARRKDLQSKIPYGPQLALGATLWMFCGPACVDWYLSLASAAGRAATLAP